MFFYYILYIRLNCILTVFFLFYLLFNYLGGVYESDKFYQMSNKYGIMIWQDLMFACSMYPSNKEFLENVVREIDYQVLRLSNHPSIIVWSFNNENEAALRENWYNTSSNFPLYHKDYIKLYIETIKKIVDRDHTRPSTSSR